MTSQPENAPSPHAMMPALTRDRDRRAVGGWLLAMCGLVFLMVVVGGATRLTESGLSMVDWRPVTGILPPLSDDAWAAEFAKYRTSPEYRLKNAGMSLDEFKTIFYWEWGHRLLGRLIGLAFALPLLFFWLKGRIPPGYGTRLLALFFLGGAQGLLGWFMVKSGLVDEPAVSHYRLAAHLGLALVIFAALFRTALGLLMPAPAMGRDFTRRLGRIMLGVLALQIVLGALVAGLKAGMIYNQWPLMGEGLVPPGLLHMAPWWLNFLENAVTVQFDHRIGAYVLMALGLWLGWRGWRLGGPVRVAAVGMSVLLLLQAALGIVTLVKAVPVVWGTAHQGVAVLLLAAVLYFLHLHKGRVA
ncbi:COX15/CtaA family protein [Yunchengibacter salinarum]|uniref:COX15/CtaA family protein n=1 Tax=Yunchengibacter salinarum TaxID=3133399 RepID=UPI0035B662CB